MLRPVCWFPCPQTHLSWILLLNQIWTLPSRVENPLEHGLTISTLFRVTFQWLLSIKNRCIPSFLWDPPPYSSPYLSAQCSCLPICILPILPALTQVLLGLGNLPRDVPFSDTWFSSSASRVWDLPEAVKQRHRGSSPFTPAPTRAVLLFFLSDIQKFCFRRASHSSSWQCLGISGWCCRWGSLALGCWLRSKTPYGWLIYKNQNAAVLI